jgi:hypothetical protein
MRASWTLLALLMLSSATARADDLEAAWAGRGDAAGLERAIGAYEAASRQEGAGIQVFERLARLRFLEADGHPEESEGQVAGCRRCVADGLRGLARLGAADGSALDLPDVAALDEARGRIGKPAAGLLYATTICHGPTIPAMSIFRQAGAALRFKRLLERSVALDGTVQAGGPHRSLAQFLHEAPAIMGGDDGRARREAEAAVAVEPRLADNRVVRAVAARCPAGEAAGCAEDLRAAAALPDDAVPGLEPEQRRGRDWARKEMARRGL